MIPVFPLFRFLESRGVKNGFFVGVSTTRSKYFCAALPSAVWKVQQKYEKKFIYNIF